MSKWTYARSQAPIESGVNINQMDLSVQPDRLDVDIVKLLPSQPDIDLTVQFYNDNTVLHEAVEADNVEALLMLLDHPRDGNIDARNKYGKTAADMSR